jgi:two-component system phosphate regulon sensor histidine kinase PhoR
LIAARLTLGFLIILGGAVLILGFVIYRSLPDGMTGQILAVLLLVFVVAMVLVILLVQGITRPLGEFARVVRQLADGDWNARVNYRNQDELGEAALSLNNFSYQVRKTLATLEESKGRLETILVNMESGVLLVNSKGQVVLVNPAAEETLSIVGRDILGKSQVEAFQNYSLSSLISGVLAEGKARCAEISLFYPEERILEVTAAPVLGEHSKKSGVVVVLYDITRTRRLERMRAEFMANVSHELKTPVTSIRGFAETLLDGALYNHRSAEEFVNIINDEANRLSRLVNDLLELSRIEFREVKPQLMPLDLTSKIKEIVDMMEPRFRKKNLSLDAVLPNNPVIVQADSYMIRQTIENLLDNSLKYTPEGGQVTIMLLSEPEEAVVVVEDNGVGIPPQDLSRVFERFYRVDKTRSRKLGGTGLGLAIVKHIVSAHGGRVWAESEPGRGSSFYFTLPGEKTGGAGRHGGE